MLRDRSLAPANPAARKLKFKSSTKLAPTENRIFPPQRGSAGDPTLGGATVTVYNAAGKAIVAVVPLPPGPGWTMLGSATNPRGFRWKGPAGSAISSLKITPDRITIRGGGAGLGYPLDDPPQGAVGLRLALAGGTAWCTAAPAKTSGNPPSSVKHDRQDRFTGQPRTPTLGSCPAVP